MTIDIQLWQNGLWALIAVFVLLVAAAVIIGVAYVSRLLTARLECGGRTLQGWTDGPVTASAALRKHRSAAIAALAAAGLALLTMLGLLGDSRMNVINKGAADVLTLTGRLETIEPRSLTDGLILFPAEEELTFGVRLTVDGTVLHALSVGQAAVGDIITLQYLPRSRCVLYIGDGSSLPYPAVTSPTVSTAPPETLRPVKSMAFAYEDYQRSFGVEAVLCVIAGCLLIRTMIGVVVSLVRRRMNLEHVLRTAFAVFVLIHLLMAGCSSVWNGGWRLMLESPEQAVSATGRLEAIEPLNSNRGTKLSTEWGTKFGCWFTIEGERYFSMYEGDLSAGETVTLQYLPQSRCILTISTEEE